MNTKQLLIILLGIGIFVVLVVMINQNSSLNKGDDYIYSSRDNALTEGMHEITGENQSINDNHDWIIKTAKNGGKEYCLFAVPYEEAGLKKYYSFIAIVEEHEGKYAFFKLTADVALNSPGGIEDKQNADSIVFYFDNVDGYYICVGKVFREDVAPYANGKQLPLNPDGIFSHFNKGARPEITIH